MTEGAALYAEGINPYLGDIFHETPLSLVVFTWLIENVATMLPVIFVAMDLLTALLLHVTATCFMNEMVSSYSL